MSDQELNSSLKRLSFHDLLLKQGMDILKGADIQVEASRRKDILQELQKASKSSDRSQEMYQLICERPKEFLAGLLNLNDIKGTVLVNVFQMSDSSEQITKLMKILRIRFKEENTASALKFYLGIECSLVTSFNVANTQHLPVLLSLLNPIKYLEEESDDSASIFTLVLLLVIKNYEIHPMNALEEVSSYLELLIETYGDNRLIEDFFNLICCLKMVFPIFTETAVVLYLSSGCHKALVLQIKQISFANLANRNSKLLVMYLLQLMDASCISEECRNFNFENYSDLLYQGFNLDGIDFRTIQSQSVLCIIKMWNSFSADKMQRWKGKLDLEILLKRTSDTLKNNNLDEINDYIGNSIESLAFLSSLYKIRNTIRQDEDLIESLISLFDVYEYDNTKVEGTLSALFGLLTIFSNLTEMKFANSKNTDDLTRKFLKNYASLSQNRDSTKEDTKDIEKFCEHLIRQYDFIKKITSLQLAREETQKGVQKTSNKSVNLIIQILYLMSFIQDREIRQKLAQHGVGKLCLSYLLTTSITKKTTQLVTRPSDTNDELLNCRLYAIRILARLLISINPVLLFQINDAITSLPFLIELLGPGNSENDTSDLATSYLHEKVTKLDTFESLMALTNLAGANFGSSSELKKLIVEKTFDDYLNVFIWDSSSPEIQRASWELICNLFTEPNLLVKFLNTLKKENKARLKLLVALLDSTDTSLQLIIASLLANGTSEYDMMCEILVENEDIFESLVTNIVSILENRELGDDITLRAGYVLISILFYMSRLSVNATSERRILDAKIKLKNGIAKRLELTKNQEVLQILAECYKLV